MNKNAFQYLNETIFVHFLKEKPSKSLTFIKKNNHLNKVGDFTFPINSKVWTYFIQKVNENSEELVDNIFYYKKYSTDYNELEILNLLIEESKEWVYPLKKVMILKDKCICFLQRKHIIRNSIYQVLKNNDFCKEKKRSAKSIYLENNENQMDKNVSCYRANLLKSVVHNLLEFTEWTVYEYNIINIDNLVKIKFFSRGEKSKKLESASTISIQCGIVCDSKSKKIVKITYPEYLSLRSRNMQLIAMHKYGVRVHDEENDNELINKLGKAAVIIDFLEVNYASPVSILTTGTGYGSSKGASFIVYNYARCETILRTFYEKQKSGYYPELPPLEEVDETVLEREEEWYLFFNFILYFPEVLKRSIDGIENGKCAPHLICQFLSNFAGAFSVYYRRVKILTENREHLLTMLFARIYLVKCIKNIFLLNFKILGIDPVNYM